LNSIGTIEPLVVDGETQAEILLLADFLKFTANYQGRVHAEKVLLASITRFTETYLTTTDVHSLVAPFDSEARKSVLSSYFLALSTLENKLPPEEVPRPPPSALLSAAAKGEASIFGLFGGQGTNEVYFDELRNLYDIYRPYVAPLIETVSKDLLNPLSIKAESDGHSFYSYGLDIASWLDGSAPVPPIEYLASIPVSFPLIGLTQLVQYLAACRSSNMTPGGMRKLLKGATGHSQGIVSAVAIAASECLESFTENTTKALKWLFFCGLRGQEAFPVLAIDPSLVKDSVEGGEGVPSPMLSITGLALNLLEKHITSTNKYLATNSRMAISLYNGPKAFVVTGPARSLCGLVTSLRKIRAATGLDQSKIPFSQRKAAFSVRFLTVGVPYHSQYLEGVTEKVTELDLGEVELWKPEDLHIPVYHTEDGSSCFDYGMN
jgi:fatty acid synthase subunit alpha, fungi type